MDGQAGRLPTESPDEEFESAFPDVSAALGVGRVQALALLSYLVGMVCPGLHSILAKLEIDVVASVQGDSGVTFSAVVDERFRAVDLAVNGSGISGKVSAFARLPPVEPKGLAEIAALVEPGEFQGMNALIVGGSRGLGATTAKIIAAGGGHVSITFASAQAEADAVARDIGKFRGEGNCEVLSLDVFDKAGQDLHWLRNRVTHLYYFATPQIFQQRPDAFAADLFLRFAHVYVVAFEAICRSLKGENELSVFYPSSIAVEQRPRGMVEYSMAKAAGEILCAELEATVKGLHVSVVRLPRILTDQTATVPPVACADALSTMLPIVRSMASASGSRPLARGDLRLEVDPSSSRVS